MATSLKDWVFKVSIYLCFLARMTLDKLAFFIAAVLISSGPFAQGKFVKMSNSGICHAPNTTYYEQTRNFTPYKTLEECLKAGGRMPKK